MIKKYIAYSFLLFIFSCSGVEFVLKDNSQTNPLKEKTLLLIDKESEEKFVRGLYSYFGNNEKYEYILKTTFLEEKDPRLARAGVSGFNKPKGTPSHPTKSHIVVAKSGGQVKTIRFGEQGASTAGDPKAGESDKMKKKRKSFKARHAKNIAKGKMSAAYWADKVKW